MLLDLVDLVEIKNKSNYTPVSILQLLSEPFELSLYKQIKLTCKQINKQMNL